MPSQLFSKLLSKVEQTRPNEEKKNTKRNDDDNNKNTNSIVDTNKLFSFYFQQKIIINSMYVSVALVGLLLVGVQCGESDFDAVVLNSNLFGDQPADNSQYWWMSKGSPFKRAVAAGPPQQQFDFGANPFLRSKCFSILYINKLQFQLQCSLANSISHSQYEAYISLGHKIPCIK